MRNIFLFLISFYLVGCSLEVQRGIPADLTKKTMTVPATGWKVFAIKVEDLDQYASHSIRKTKATVIFNKTRNIDAVRRLLGQSSVTATSSYIGVTDNSALELARNINV